MRIVIQDIENGTFLAGNGRWVDTEEEAADFIMTRTAHAVASAKKLRNYQVITITENPDQSSLAAGAA
jgi:hypothetical protein